MRIPARKEILADSTDGEGMIRALKKRVCLSGKNVMLVGAGGAALSIAYELLSQSVQLSIINIVPEDGQKLAKFLGSLRPGVKVQAFPWGMMCRLASSADIIISAISSGTPLDAEALYCLPGECIFADARYGSQAEFMHAVRRAGRECIDGREMLYGQFRIAAEKLEGLANSSLVTKTLDEIENGGYV